MISKKTTIFLSLIIILACILASCTMNNDKTREVSDKPIDIISKTKANDQLTLTYWVPIEVWAAPAIKSYDDNEIFKEVENITNIHIKWIHPVIGQEKEQFSLMIASNELPDIIQQAYRYQGGVSNGVKDGVFLKLNNLIDEYAPNYKWIRSLDPEINKGTVDDEGNICAFYNISLYEEWTWWGPLLRKDWLNDIDREVPITIEDWYLTLKAFRDVKGSKAPLLFPANGMDWCSIFMSSYDAYSGLYYKDGKVQYGPVQSGMKDYIIEMRKWYTEGLIDKYFAGRDWDQWKLMAQREAGAYLQSPDTMLSLLELKGIDIIEAPYPILQEGDQLHMRQKISKVLGVDTAVTTQCAHPKEAVKWLDFGYGKEGWELYNYGIEKRTHIKNDEGNPEFWDESIVYNDPEGIPALNALWKYKLHWGPFVRDEHNANPILVKNKDSQRIRKFWTETNDGAYWMPSVTLLPEEAKREAIISLQINTYVDEMVTKFIMGIEPIDHFDDYVNQINNMGLEEILEMWQAAVIRYESR